jgi:hypothetical protein
MTDACSKPLRCLFRLEERSVVGGIAIETGRFQALVILAKRNVEAGEQVRSLRQDDVRI